MDSKTKTIIVYLKYKENASWDGLKLLRKGGLLLCAGHDITQLIGLNEPEWDEIVVAEYSEENAYNQALTRLKKADLLEYYKVHLVIHFPQAIIDRMNKMLKALKKKNLETVPIKELFSKEQWEAAKKAGTDHLGPTPNQMETLLQRDQNIPVVMLNYLKFRDVAIYPDDFEGKRYKSGREAYQKYGQRDSHNNQVDIFGNYKSTIVGEDEPNWENFVFVRYPSVKDFIGMIATKSYQASSTQRSAGLENTILLSITPYDEPY
ncbi:MAG: hypothetical protein ACTSPS_14760 [Promethearchaeota archaeon]